MMMIVAHHFVVNSGLSAEDGPLVNNPMAAKSIFLLLFGAWGKTGINCFMLITGYFMCTSRITLRKFVKLMAQIYLYRLLLYPILLVLGYESFSCMRFVKVLLPFWGFNNGFTSCFIIFYLTIPFWTILVQNMTKKQHEILLFLLLSCYTLLGSIPTFKVTFNYITWFGVIFLIASYVRLHPSQLFERRSLWGCLTLISVLFSMTSIVLLQKFIGAGHFLLTDCNKFFAVVVAVCSFLWFKNLNIKYNKVINAFGAATFGVLLIHANSDAMRTWLWTNTVDAVGHYQLPLMQFAFYSVAVVLAVFIICNLIDQLRIATVEKAFLKWYDKHYENKFNKMIKTE